MEKLIVEKKRENVNKDYSIVFDFSSGLLSDKEFLERFEMKLLHSNSISLNTFINGELSTPTTTYFVIEDKQSEKKCLVSMPTRGGKLTENSLDNLRLILPYAKREFTLLNGQFVLTHNLERNKKGIFDLQNREYSFVEEYDTLIPTINSKFIIGASGKYGIVSTVELEQMPIEYENLTELHRQSLDPNGFSNLHVLSYRETDLWGANVYIRYLQKKENVAENGDIEYNQESKKYAVPCIWEKINLFAIIDAQNIFSYECQTEIEKIIFEVTFDGKKGLYCAYNNLLIMPPIFDEIEKYNNTLQHQQDLRNNIWYGYINGEKYIVKDGQIFKCINTNDLENETIKKVRQLLP